MYELDTHEIRLLREEVKNGLDIDEAIRRLHQYQCTIMECIKFVVSEYEIGLGDAKEKVSSHPVWSSVVKAAEPLHDEIIEALSATTTKDKES